MFNVALRSHTYSAVGLVRMRCIIYAASPNSEEEGGRTLLPTIHKQRKHSVYLKINRQSDPQRLSLIHAHLLNTDRGHIATHFQKANIYAQTTRLRYTDIYRHSAHRLRGIQENDKFTAKSGWTPSFSSRSFSPECSVE